MPAIAFAAIAAAFLWPALGQGGIFLALDLVNVSMPWAAALTAPPHNGLLSDPIAQYYPWRHFVYETLRAGRWPLWNPFILGGHPTFASVNEQIFYPLNAVLAPFPAEQTFAWLAWLHLTIAGLGTCLFVRLHLADDASACLAGIVFMLSGPMVVWLEYPAFASTLSWTGLIFYFLERTLRERRPRSAVLTGATIGISLLGGQTQYSLFIATLAVAYTTIRLATMWRQVPRSAMRAAGLTAVAAAIGGGIGAIAYVPAIELFGLTSRAPFSRDQFAGYALPMANALTFAVPNAFGTPIRADFVGFFNYNETATYFGLLPLLLLLLALIVRPRPSLALPFGAVTAIAILLLFGWHPVVDLWWLLPPFRSVGLNRLAAVLPFAGGVVAAAAYDVLPSSGTRRFWVTGAATVLVAGTAFGLVELGSAASSRTLFPSMTRGDLILAITLTLASLVVLLARIWLPRRGISRWLGPALVAIDLFAFGVSYNTISPAHAIPGSIPPPLASLSTGAVAAPSVGISVDRLVLGANLGMLWNLPTPDGYTSEPVARFGAFVGRANPVDGEQPSTQLHPGGDVINFAQARPAYLNLLSVRYIVMSGTPELTDAVRRPTDADSAPISGNTTVGALFRARQNGLNRLDLYPNLHGRPDSSWLALHLTTSPGNPNLLAYVRIAGSELRDGQPLTFWFKPIERSAGQQYYFFVDAPEANLANAVTLRLSGNLGQADHSGYTNGQPSNQAVAFSTYATPDVGWTKIASANQTDVYENPDALPRAFVVYQATTMSDDAFYGGLDDGSLDPGRVAAVAASAPNAFAASLVTQSPRAASPVQNLTAAANELDLDCTLGQPGLLVVTNTWYPGWTALVDGEPRPVVRVDATFQGVYLGPGSHHVRLIFAPESLRLGLALAGISLILASGMLAADWHFRVRT